MARTSRPGSSSRFKSSRTNPHDESHNRNMRNPFRKNDEERGRKLGNQEPRGFTLHRPVAMIAIEALNDVMLEGRYADKVIERAFKSQKKMGARDRRLFAEIVYDLVRWWRKSSAAFGWNENNKPQKSDLWKWLAVLIVEKNLKETGEPRLPKWPEFERVSADKIAHRLSEIDPVEDRAIFESIPDWMDKLGEQELGGRWPGILHSLNLAAPVFIRANTLKCTREALAKRLRQEDEIFTNPAEQTTNGLMLNERKNVFVTQAFKDGWLEVQDGASQQVAEMLGAQPGDRVIDACAGAGGKTLAIGAMMQNKGKIIALDVHEGKLQELRKRVARGGLDTCEARLIESQKVIKRLEATADRVLLDVPCSGLGVLRRNPDAKWKLSMQEVERLRELQSQILDEYSVMVKPGGILVYATCSILPSENHMQVEKFLRRRNQDKTSGAAKFEMIRDREFLPGVNRYDGFYAAVMRRI
jgi:16S rRNA (cytosine967-C5)-methyltransferase